MTSVDVLRRAREFVARPGGWCQGVYENPNGAVCAAGAIGCGDANGLNHERRTAYAVLQSVCGISGSISEWNDAPERTQAEVVAAFDKAIALAEQAGGPTT